MQILTIQNLVNELDKVGGGIKKAKPETKAPEKEEAPKAKKKTDLKAPMPQAPQEEVTQIQEAANKEKDKDEGDDHLLRPSSFFGS